ncbi:hypothetical protein [Streptomyces sp. NPDC051561]
MPHETHQSLENDGVRMTVERTAAGVVLRSKAGHVVTSSWMDLAWL